MSGGIVSRIRQVGRSIGLRRFWQRPKPSNWVKRDVSPEAVAQDALYGLGCGQGYRRRMRAAGQDVVGNVVLEVGPGTGFGAMAYLAAHGAQAAVADRWLAPWQPDYHGAYYAKLADEIEKEKDGGDPEIVRKLARSGKYDGGPIRLIPEAAEALSSVPDRNFHAIFSNAVLEHFADVEAALRELYRVTRDGGLGGHQIDMRDHRDFSKPLEHLLLSKEAFRGITSSHFHEFGSQHRRHEYVAAFESAGFKIVDFAADGGVSEDYVKDFIPRLRAAVESPYRNLPREEIEAMSGFVTVRR